MTIVNPLHFLLHLDPAAALSMFWFLIVLDIPRYSFAFLAVLASEMFGRAGHGGNDRQPLVSVVIAGHNERRSVRLCVRSLREQTHKNIEIVCIDDGSVDRLDVELRRLRDEGLIDTVFVTSLRCGKSSVCNFGISRARGDLIVNVDVDCTFDRDAIARIVAPFQDPAVGAVSGNIGVRNLKATMLTGLQAIEYLVSISLGKRVLDFLGIVTCASGAFSAFRRQALETVGGMDGGSGEDLDLTLRLRKAGWKIRFAEDAWCLTDVPETPTAFARQRLRWERDAVRVRLRRHRNTLDPRNRAIGLTERLHQIEFLITNVAPTFAFPFYLVWLFAHFGSGAWTILMLVAAVYIVIDLLAIACALTVLNRPGLWRVWPFALVYGVFNAFLMRSFRIYAYINEWIFRTSY